MFLSLPALPSNILNIFNLSIVYNILALNKLKVDSQGLDETDYKLESGSTIRANTRYVGDEGVKIVVEEEIYSEQNYNEYKSENGEVVDTDFVYNIINKLGFIEFNKEYRELKLVLSRS